MDGFTAADSPLFLFGVTLGAALLCAGILVGLAVARRSGLAETPAETQQVLTLMRGLSAWTHDVSRDVNEYQQVVKGVTQQIHARGETMPEAQNAPALWLSDLVHANQHLQQRLEEAEGTLQRQSDELAAYMSAARTDALTGLQNRRAFDDELRRRIAEWRRQGQPFSVLLADVDHFKKFNDEHGHLAGDKVLIAVGEILMATMRETDVVARFGGEEFAMILPSSIAAEAAQVAERVRSAIENGCCMVEQQALRVTVSCGVAHATAEDTSESLIARADAAMYASKNAGRNAAHWHDGRQCRLLTRRAAASTTIPAATAAPISPGIMPGGNIALAGLEHHAEYSQVCSDLRRRLLELTTPNSARSLRP